MHYDVASYTIPYLVLRPFSVPGPDISASVAKALEVGFQELMKGSRAEIQNG
jgi:hypothetical protein